MHNGRVTRRAIDVREAHLRREHRKYFSAKPLSLNARAAATIGTADVSRR
jgi:hypothetical protein